MNNDIKLKKALPLIINGEQGTGKSTLARVIAAKHGTYNESSMAEIQSQESLAIALQNEPETLIVEEFIGSESELLFVKEMCTQDLILIKLPHQKHRTVKTPNFIFVAQMPLAIPFEHNERRFQVIEL